MKLTHKLIKFPLFCTLSISLSLVFNQVIQAQTPENAPPKLVEIIGLFDQSVNNKDTNTLKQLISPNFTSKEGLTFKSLPELLQKKWQDYPNLTYKTTLKSWEEKNNQLLAETVTEISGDFVSDGRKINLFSTINSLQFFENGKLVKQKILAERTDLTSGDNPPEIKVNLPKKVKPGQKFNFDVILTEPLDYNLLLGGAMEKTVNEEAYQNPAEIELSTLLAGGIFKLVSAPLVTNDQWYSALLIRADGLRLITQRVLIED